MATRRYLNFDLLLEQEGEGRYQARVTDSPLGETPSVHFALPFDATTLENLLLKLDPGRTGTRRVGSNPMQQAAMDFGGPLYQAIFTGDLGVAWTRSLDRVRSENAGGLRLRLRLNDAPAIAGLPWELLYDARSNSFIAQSERTPLVRFLDVPEVPKPMAVDGPLRVLAIISSPTDLDELDVEAEWTRLHEALAPRLSTGLVVLDRLPSPTLSELGTWLRRSETHVVHFVGHGDFDEGLREGVIYFQDETGRRSPVTASTLGPYLRDHDPLRMVVLNACRSARTDSVDPFSGMAQGLVQQDASAVVAMQFPISDKAAVKFTGEFYGALVDGLPVDQAVSSARKALLDGFRDEWATPVLFLRAPDGNIFENVHAAAGDVPVPMPPPPTPTPTPPTGDGPASDPEPSVTGRAPFPANRRLVLVGAGALVGVVLLVVVLVNVLGGGDESAGGDGEGTGQTETPIEPAVRVDLQLPQSDTPLPDTQMLVAAGAASDLTSIWRIDVDDPAQDSQISVGDEQEWLPSLTPDRLSAAYSRLKHNTKGDYEVRAGGALQDEGDTTLFRQSPPECGRHAGRPTWTRTAPEPFMVLLCRDTTAAGTQRLLRIGLDGTVDEIPVRDPDGNEFGAWGDPALSPDGSFVVVWTAQDPDARAGALWAITLADDQPHLLLAARDRVLSDAVFSPTDASVLAYRTNLHPETDVPDDLDIVIAHLNGFKLTGRRTLSLPGTNEEDPSFSPDGARLVFTSNQTSLMVVGTSTGDPVPVATPPDFPAFVRVPSWSSR